MTILVRVSRGLMSPLTVPCRFGLDRSKLYGILAKSTRIPFRIMILTMLLAVTLKQLPCFS